MFASDFAHPRRRVGLRWWTRLDLALHSPAVEWAPTFLAGLNELDDRGERAAWIYAREAGELPRRDFAAYVQLLAARAQSPAPGLVPDSVYWAIRDREMVGRVSFDTRSMNTCCAKAAISASSCDMLRQLLSNERARALGRLVVTCDEGNIASERTIRANGGILEDVIVNDNGPRTMRFWISVGQ